MLYEVITQSVIDMQTIAKEVITELKGSYPLVQFDISIDELPPAQGDALMIRQVFVNLLSNAMKFSYNFV